MFQQTPQYLFALALPAYEWHKDERAEFIKEARYIGLKNGYQLLGDGEFGDHIQLCFSEMAVFDTKAFKSDLKTFFVDLKDDHVISSYRLVNKLTQELLQDLRYESSDSD